MPWYGWVPILTHELLLEETSIEARKRIISTPCPNTYLLHAESSRNTACPAMVEETRNAFPAEALATIREVLSAADDDEVFCYLKNIDDLSSSAFKRVAIRAQDGNLIKSVAILSHPTFDTEVVASIEEITPDGLVTFVIQGGRYQAFEKIYAKPIFAITRDFYHEHIYVTSTDFALRPVYADERKNAVIEIFRQYEKKILDYHRQIKHELNDLETCPDHQSRLPVLDLVRVTSSSCGEMVYANSFVRLFNLADDYRSTIDLAAQSFSVLRNRVESLQALKAFGVNRRLVMLTVVLTFIAIYTVIQKFTSPGYSIPISVSITIGIYLLVILLNLLTGKWRT